jgi:hypothetical protein
MNKQWRLQQKAESSKTIQTNITTPGIAWWGINGRKVNVTTRCDLIHSIQ